MEVNEEYIVNICLMYREVLNEQLTIPFFDEIKQKIQVIECNDELNKGLFEISEVLLMMASTQANYDKEMDKLKTVIQIMKYLDASLKLNSQYLKRYEIIIELDDLFPSNKRKECTQKYIEEELTTECQNNNIRCFVIESNNNPNTLCLNYLKHAARYIPTKLDQDIFNNVFIELKTYAGKDKYGDFYGDDYVHINQGFKIMTPKPDYYSDNKTEDVVNSLQLINGMLNRVSIKNFGLNSKKIIKMIRIGRREITNWATTTSD
jgi:hypothetical protein